MLNVTNGINNIGKLFWQQRFQLSISFDELQALMFLTQNPHESYVKPELAKSISEDIKMIMDNLDLTE